MLVVDADLPKRLAPALRYRGRKAISATELGLAFGVKDPELLRRLAELYEGQDWALVTGDDAMPAEHGPVIIETGATVATIHPEPPAGVTMHCWRTDVVQRWVHAMQEQERRTVRRYGFSRSEPWQPRRRHTRTIAREALQPWRPEDAAQAHAAGERQDPRAGWQRLPGIG